jgi:hypothetical protein
MIDSNITSRVAAGLAAIDVSAENMRIAELRDDIAAAQRAIEAARDRVAEIHQASPDAAPYAVASALLVGTRATEAAAASRTRDELARERAALQAAIPDLKARIAMYQQEIGDLQNAATSRARDIVEPLVDQLLSEAREAGELLLEAYLGLEAVKRATGAGHLQASAAGKAVNGLLSDYGLLPRRQEYEVPAEIVTALSSLAGKGPAIKAALLSDFDAKSMP